MKILVTCPPMLRQIDAFESVFQSKGWEVTTPDVVQTLSIDELCDIVPSHDGWIIGDDPAEARVVAAGKDGSLRAAVKWGVGTDNVDFPAFEESGIPVTHTPGMFGDEVADIALGYVIGLARHTFEIHQGVLSGNWPKPAGLSLRGKTIGLAGYGDIGRQLAIRLRACGMNIVVYDPFVTEEQLTGSADTSLAVWPESLQHCDFLCFTCALTESSHHMLDGDALNHCKQGVRIVNVARGPLIDEAALEAALASGQVSSVALDVFEQEPLSADSELRNYPQNIFGSHNASNTVDAVFRTSEKAIQLLDDLLS